MVRVVFGNLLLIRCCCEFVAIGSLYLIKSIKLSSTNHSTTFLVVVLTEAEYRFMICSYMKFMFVHISANFLNNLISKFDNLKGQAVREGIRFTDYSTRWIRRCIRVDSRDKSGDIGRMFVYVKLDYSMIYKFIRDFRSCV